VVHLILEVVHSCPRCEGEDRDRVISGHSSTEAFAAQLYLLAMFG
jgi:hypothetical protein